MKPYLMLREYLRTCRRVKLKPSQDGFKKMEYLKFIGADVCPACGEDASLDFYLCVRDGAGGILEKYRCPACGMDYFFPRSVIH